MAGTLVRGVLRVGSVGAVSLEMISRVTRGAWHVEVVQEGVPPIGEAKFSALMTCGVARGRRAEGGFGGSILGGQR